VSEQSKKPDQDETEVSILDFDVDDAAIEIAAASVGTIPSVRQHHPAELLRPATTLSGASSIATTIAAY